MISKLDTPQKKRIPGLQSLTDIPPASVHNKNSTSRIVLTCEHAGNHIPSQLGSLGLSAELLSRHIAWDIGAAPLARRLAEKTGATLILQNYSRLIVDCNRPITSEDAVPEVSDETRIKGNFALSRDEIEHRFQEIHTPYHQEITAALDKRVNEGIEPVLFSIHSFTPQLQSSPVHRPWDLGLLYNKDNRLALLFRKILEQRDHGFVVADNQPYTVSSDSDFTLPVHGEKRGIPALLLEVRNDHLKNNEGIILWADLLHDVITELADSV